jgi:hypothetical protein
MLRRAIDAGYRDLDSVRKDRAFDPLRSTSDFEALIFDVAFPSNSFAR